MVDSSLRLEFPAVAGRKVIGEFDGGDLSSDGGWLLVAQADQALGLTAGLAEAIDDQRTASKVRYDTLSILRERIYGILLGYEDANDMDTLRNDPGLKVACQRRPSEENALASQPTISRFENAVTRRDLDQMARQLARWMVARLPADTHHVWLDLDTTCDPTHGQQEFSLFDGYYKTHCYQPLCVFVTDETGRQRLMGAVLRSAAGRSTKAFMGTLRRAVEILRERFPALRITVRGDCAFGYGELMNWCDAHDVDYLVAFQATDKMRQMTVPTQIRAAIAHKFRGDGCREYGEAIYCGETWARARRLVVKAEATSEKRVDVRFVVTSHTGPTPEEIYTQYTARGDRENRIKELKLDLCSGRTSCHRFLANQCRLLLHAAACMLAGVLQQGLEGTRWARAQVCTLRVRLLKVAARVVESCRCVWFHLPTSFPERDIWQHLHQRLSALVT